MIGGIYRMTARQFHTAIEAGVFGDRHVELLGGVPFRMSDSPPHLLAALRVQLTIAALAAPPQWVVNKEHRLALGQWRPLPDVVVLKGLDDVFGTRPARAADVALLVEVADAAYGRGSGPKLRRYASFRIPAYWIVDLKRRRVEVHTQPARARRLRTVAAISFSRPILCHSCSMQPNEDASPSSICYAESCVAPIRAFRETHEYKHQR